MTHKKLVLTDKNKPRSLFCPNKILEGFKKMAKIEKMVIFQYFWHFKMAIN